MTLESQPPQLNRIRNPVLAQLSEEARHVESQSRCNSKACICYGNAIIAITLFIFSFCSIVFIIIFVEYEVIENSIEHHTLSPATTVLDSLAAQAHAPHMSTITASTSPHSTTTTVRAAGGDEQSVERAILDAIGNQPTDEDDPEEGRLNQYDIVRMNVTKMNASLELAADPGKILHYMTKSEWQADESSATSSANVMQQPPKLLTLPTKRIIVSHTGGKTCNSTFACSRILQKIQSEHTTTNHKDIGYNFLIGGNGVVFEGRGWDVAGWHTPNNNADSVGVALIGSFGSVKPTDEQMRALRSLLEWGVGSGKVDKDYKLFAQRQLHPTDSPGTMVLEIIETWPHFHIQRDSAPPVPIPPST